MKKPLLVLLLPGLAFAVSLLPAAGQTSTYSQVYFRGTSNGWGTRPMALVGDHQWQAHVLFTGAGDAQGPDRFVFDTTGDWSGKRGDSQLDGIAEPFGGDIPIPGAGTWRVSFDDATFAYSIAPAYDKNFDQVYFRGTPNGWGTQPMILVGDHQWLALATFTGAGDGQGPDRFVFDTAGDWSGKRGDSQLDGITEPFGADIPVPSAGTCQVVFNDETAGYVFSPFPLGTPGENHPASGVYAPVAEVTWAAATWPVGPRYTSEGDFELGLFSANATRILLEIYPTAMQSGAIHDYWMQKGPDNVWRAKLASLPHGTLYAFRVWGPNWPHDPAWARGNSAAGFVSDVDAAGNRFNPNKVLYDPYARELSHDKSNPILAAAGETSPQFVTGAAIYTDGAGVSAPRREVDTARWAPKAVVLVPDGESFGAKPLIPPQDAIIYEAHVRGLTRGASSAQLAGILAGHGAFAGVSSVPDAYRGTYKGAGVMAKYLKSLGFSAVEFLPIHESNDSNGAGWGYATYGFFAPNRQYAYDQSPGGPTREFKQMVRAFHDEGIEVYLDVVYNHTGEGGLWGDPGSRELTCFAGIDNSQYYALQGSDKSQYWVSSGVGNNFNAATAAVRDLIKDSLAYWLDEMGVDGARFDLATVLGRDNEPNYTFNPDAQLLLDIAAMAAARNAEVIAEAWDLATYQVGNFPAGWAEWNGRYRDLARKFIKGEGNRPPGAPASFTDMFYGSHGLYNDQGGPEMSVNFITAHDGFTMMDLVSYDAKNNGQPYPWGPSDGGWDANDSWNSNGDHALRRKQLRNIWTLLMFSRGVPMVVMGDEFARSQNGNNNAHNLDTVAVWNNYHMIATSSPTTVIPGQADNYNTDARNDGWNNLFNFAGFVTRLRADHPALRQGDYSVGYAFHELDGTGTIDDDDRCVWVLINGAAAGDDDFLLFLNTFNQDKEFTLPAPGAGKKWVRIIDTAEWAESAADNIWDIASGWSTTVAIPYGVKSYSIAVFEKTDL